LAARNKKNGKAPSAGITSRTVGIFLVLLFIFIFEFFLRTWCGVQCIRVGYEITEATERQEDLLDRRKNLEIELARLRSPNTLNRIAEPRFGLVTPKPDQIVVLP